MKVFVTQIDAVDSTDGVLKGWFGPQVLAESQKDAEVYCQNNGLGYCKVIGELVLQEENIIHDVRRN